MHFLRTSPRSGSVVGLPSDVNELGEKKKQATGVVCFVLSHFPDSNRGPTHYECVALPTEPKWRKAGAKVLLLFEMAKFFGIIFV